MADGSIRSVRITELQRKKIGEIKEEDARLSTRRRLTPRKEGAILSSAVAIGISDLHRQTVGWRWRCDACRKPIELVSDGWLEWVNTEKEEDPISHSLRLVHHKNGCMFNEAKLPVLAGEDAGRATVGDMHLSDYVAPLGLHLIDLMTRRWADKIQVHLMYRRLFLGGFEQLRHLIPEDEQLEVGPAELVHYLKKLREDELNEEVPSELASDAMFAMALEDDDD